jgi:hypothetical protein
VRASGLASTRTVFKFTMLIRGALRLIGAAARPERVSRPLSQSALDSISPPQTSSPAHPPQVDASPPCTAVPEPLPSVPEAPAVWTPAASAVMVPVAPPRRLRALGLSNPSPRQAASIQREAEDRNAGTELCASIVWSFSTLTSCEECYVDPSQPGNER